MEDHKHCDSCGKIITLDKQSCDDCQLQKDMIWFQLTGKMSESLKKHYESRVKKE
jgi:hypothetical protein